MVKKTGKATAQPTGKKVTKTPAKAAKAKQPKPAVIAAAAEPAPLPSVRQLIQNSALLLWRDKQLFGGIMMVYGLLNLLLVHGFSSASQVSSLKTTLQQAVHGHASSISSSASNLGTVLGAGSSGSGAAGSYQFFLTIIVSLAFIWALRQRLAGHALRIRDAYYRGMYPLIPFLLVLAVIGLQLLPAVIGATLYSLVMSNAVAVSLVEKLFWLLILCLGLALSLYLLSSSLIALYAVTLPDMVPLKALRLARQLVKRRRWLVLRKVVCLLLILLLVVIVIMVPVIIIITPLTQVLFFVLTLFLIAASHSYLYHLYRGLLHD